MSDESNANRSETSFALALGLSLLAFGLAFVTNFQEKFGLARFNLPVLLQHPQALSELLAEAFGGSLLLASLHVALASCFKSKRNPASRRRIFIGWSICIILLNVLHMMLKK